MLPRLPPAPSTPDAGTVKPVRDPSGPMRTVGGAGAARLGVGLLLLAAITAFILYGSLYPFRFAGSWGNLDPAALLRARAQPPGGRGDLIANLLLYAPFGFAFVLCLPRRMAAPVAVLLAVLAATLLSSGIETVQALLPQRTTSLWDVLCNAAGAFGGGVIGVVTRARVSSEPGGGLVDRLRAEPFALLLLLAWLGYRLYPYIPSLDLQAIRNSVKPLLLAPLLDPVRSARLAVCWLVFACLLQQVVGPRAARMLVPAMLIGVPASAVLIVERSVTLPDVIGAGAALLGWLALRTRLEQRATLLALAGLMLAAIVAERLEPFDFGPSSSAFGWIPFRSLFSGDWGAGVQSMLDKAFRYGSLIWLATRGGLGLPVAAGGTVVVLLGTSVMQTAMPGRSAEITDAVLALGMAAILWALPRSTVEPSPVEQAGPPTGWRARAHRALEGRLPPPPPD